MKRVRLTAAEKLVLLRVRAAMRFRFDENRPKPPTPEQAAEEQHATCYATRISHTTWEKLRKRGLITDFPFRLTVLGWTALEPGQ